MVVMSDDILNITATSSIGHISPDQHLYGQTPDISPTLCFQFYKPVYYSDTDSFPAPVEKKGRWVSIAPNICWKPLSPFSNVHFRNTTKIAVQVLCSFSFGYFYFLAFSQTMSLSCIFVFALLSFIWIFQS